MSHPKRASLLRRLFLGDATPNLPKENPFEQKELVISGRRLVGSDEARSMADIEIGDPGLSFGGIKVGSKTHFIVCGQTQSGKTTLLKQMMAEALLRIKKGSDERAVIYDATGDFVPFVYGILGDDAPVVILDPEDERGYAWDVSADIATPAQARNLADILIPQEEQDEPFFLGGARSVTCAMLENFLLHNEEAKKNGERFSWTLRDLFNALETKETAKEVLQYWTGKGIKEFEHEINLYLERSNNDILSTVATKSAVSRMVAAMWDGRPTLSIKEFVESADGKIIIITNSNESSSVVKELNRLFFERLSQTLLDARSFKEKRTHLFLDEFTELGKLDALKKLLKLGLKKGVRVYLCYQNFEDVKETYGDNQASVILSESGTIAFLRQTGDSAKAAAEFLGKQIVVVTNRSTSASGGGEQGLVIQSGEQEQQAERWTVEPEAFSKRIQPAGKKNGVSGFFFSPSVPDVWFHRFEWRELHRIAIASSEDERHEPKKPRDEKEGIAYQFLRKWSETERGRFIRIEIPEKAQTQNAEQANNAAMGTIAETAQGFNLSEYLNKLQETVRDDRPSSELNAFDKVKQGRGELDLDEMEEALRDAGFHYRD